MKKLILSVILSALAFTSFAMQATVVSTKGKAEVQNGGAWVALKAGDSLDQGSVIQTGFKSEVVIKIKESTVTVAQLSRITLQTLAEREGLNGALGKDETSIFLDTGALRSNVQKSIDRRVGFTVRSPVATASVRGTIFDMKARYRAVNLSTIQGRVAFWKNTAKSEASLNNADPGPVGEAPEGNGPDALTDDKAPSKAVVVREKQNASVDKGGGMSSPEATAHGNSSGIGRGTQPASAAERSAPVGGGAMPGPGAIGGPGANGGSGSGGFNSTGTLNITVGFEN